MYFGKDIIKSLMNCSVFSSKCSMCNIRCLKFVVKFLKPLQRTGILLVEIEVAKPKSEGN